MPTEHEHIVQRGFDAIETADMDAFTANWHPDVVWDLSTSHDSARRVAGDG